LSPTPPPRDDAIRAPNPDWMTDPPARTGSPPADPGRHDRLPMVLGVAAATFVYEVGAHFNFDRWGLRELLDFALTAAVHLATASVMLALIDRRLVRAWGSAGEAGFGAAWPTLAVTLAACAVAGVALQMALMAWRVNVYPVDDAKKILEQVAHFLVLYNLCLAGMLIAARTLMWRRQATADALHDVALRRLRLEQEQAAAQTQLLQAQSEPHFLFNALANVRRLLRTDVAAARILLADLLRYLEEALPALRAEWTTLGGELELVRAFLSVHQVRMGERLRWQIDLPEPLASVPVPPMIVLTLVENALKHGLQPQVAGGEVQVAARADGTRLVLTVADTGRGMGSSSGHGTGLANLRARLKSHYGEAAALALALNEPSGVVATITLPRSAP
jgi:signal transduction histidine kinase